MKPRSIQVSEGLIPPGFRELRSRIYPAERFPVDPRVPDGIEHRHFLLPDEACLTAFLDPRQPGIGGIGLFEALEGAAVASLLKAAEAWLAEKGCQEVWGPLDFSIWRRYRFMTKGFEFHPFLGEPFNPAHYPARFEASGYRVLQRWSSTLGVWEDFPKALALLRPAYEQAIRSGYRFRASTSSTLEADLEIIRPILARSFQGFLAATPLSEAEYWTLARSLIPLADPETIFLVEDPDAKPVAFQITLPDPQTDRPRPLYLQLYLGRLPEGKRNRAPLGRAVLYATLAALFERQRPVDVVAPLMSGGNHSRAMASGITAPFKEYALYGKGLA